MTDATLHLTDLLEMRPDLGIIRLRTERMVLQNVAAFGTLREQLIRLLGVAQARRVLFKFGFAQGFHDAVAMGEPLVGDPMQATLGFALHTLQGMVRATPLRLEGSPTQPGFLLEAVWANSYEADQHLRHLGRCPECACWSTVGYAEGYSAVIAGMQPVLYREVECRAKGDPICRVFARRPADWGPERAAQIREEYFGPGETFADWVAALRRERLQIQSAPEPAPPIELQSQPQPARAGDQELRRLVVSSRALADVVAVAARVAPLDVSVLILGESGTGKELLARYIHEHSSRADQPLVVANCAAISESLLESELFGHVKGAFTGAVRDRPGLFEHAGQGTLFLDEIGEMSHATQAKLLRAVENREIRRVGDARAIPVRARLVAATNRDLKKAVAEGRFREDFYYRLGSFVVSIPPLRERPDDIPALVEHFLQATAARLGKPVGSVSAEAMERLRRYSWPGNVRELKHAIEQAVIVAPGPSLVTADLPRHVAEPPGARPARTAAADTPADEGDLDVHARERELILEALARYGGNRTKAAEALHMSPVTLWRRLKRYGLQGS